MARAVRFLSVELSAAAWPGVPHAVRARFPAMSVLLAVGQGGNQLGVALWDRLTELAAHQQHQQKQQHDGGSAVVAERFSSAAGTLLPRTLCIDSEPKVLQQQGCDGPLHRWHVLGSGNNWAAGYSFSTSAAQQHSASCT